MAVVVVPFVSRTWIFKKLFRELFQPFSPRYVFRYAYPGTSEQIDDGHWNKLFCASPDRFRDAKQS